MQSMIESPIPTRAEVFDVANAVIDGTDAVMLSAETATGKHVAKVIEAMDRICRGAERHRPDTIFERRLGVEFKRVDEAIAKAAMYTGQPHGRARHRGPDRIRRHAAVDVAHQLRHPDLCLDASRRDP